MKSTMMNVPLSLNHLLERAGTLFPSTEIVSRRPDKSLVRHTFGAYYRRTRALASALQGLGLVGGSFMTGNSDWLYIGLVTAVVGAFGFTLFSRGKKS